MKNIIIIGLKNSGKSTLARNISHHFNLKLIVIDQLIEERHKKIKGEILSFREIFRKHGNRYFRRIETEVLLEIKKMKLKNTIIDCAGGTPLNKDNQIILKAIGTIVLIDLDKEINFQRIIKNGIPAFFEHPENPKKSFNELAKKRLPIYKKLADFVLKIKDESPKEVLNKFIQLKI